MKNRLFAVTCYILFFFTSHTASAITCPEAFKILKNPKKALSQVVNYLYLQRLRNAIQFHKMHLTKTTQFRRSNALVLGEYYLDTLLRIPENPKLTIEQQRTFKMEIAGFLLTDYQKLYYRYGKKVEEWIFTNGNSVIRDGVLTAAKHFNRSTDHHIHVLTGLHRILLDLSTKEDIGFSSETLAYFDALPLKEKMELVGPSGDPPKFNSPKAQSLIESWGKSIRLHSGREKIKTN